MAKPYREGKSWSFRLRIKGQEIYRTGFANATEANKEARRLQQQIDNGNKPQHHGPWRTTVGEALQHYACERLPWLKGAVQDACRINRYLRSGDLKIVKLTEVTTHSTSASAAGSDKVLHWEVALASGKATRAVPNGLHAHRQKQADRTTRTDRLRKQLTRTPMAQVCAYHIQEIVDAMVQDGYKPASIALERALLRQLFNYAANIWHWPEPLKNPASKLILPKIDNARERVLSNAEWQKISEAMRRTKNPYIAPAIALLLETAMRVSEPLLRATWSDVDWDKSILRLRDSKAGARNVPLTPAAVDTLLLLKQMHSELDNADPRILPITYESLRAAWGRVCESAGIDNVNIHDLRHTATTRFALELNGNLPVLQIITGHKTFSQLKRYINLTADDVVRLMHGRPLTEDSAPAGLRIPAPKPASTATEITDPLPDNVVPFRRAASKLGTARQR